MVIYLNFMCKMLKCEYWTNFVSDIGAAVCWACVGCDGDGGDAQLAPDQRQRGYRAGSTGGHRQPQSGEMLFL